MQLSDEAKGIIVFWSGLHIIGLLMFLDKNTEHFIFKGISFLWMSEILLIAIFVFAIMIISVKDLCSKKQTPASLPENQNTKAVTNVHNPVTLKPTSIPEPPPKVIIPTQLDLKQKAISQILNERSN